MMESSALLDFVISASIISIFLLYIKYKWDRRRFENLGNKIPGPEALPLIGNLLYAQEGSLQEFFFKVVQDLEDKYYKNNLTRFWLGPILVVAIQKPDDFEAVLSHPKAIDRCIDTFVNVALNGAVASDGNQWKRQRKLTNKMFHAYLLEKFNVVFNEQSIILVNYLMKKSPTETFDICSPIKRFTLDTIVRTALGVDMYLQDDETVTFPEEISDSFDAILNRIYKPWLYPTALFKLTTRGKLMFTQIDSAHEFALSAINKRRKIVSENDNRKKCINAGNKDLQESSTNEMHEKLQLAPYIDVMLKYAKEENVNDEQLTREIMDVLVAGMDTSAVVDAYVLVLLGIYREWQDRIHTEIDEMFGDSDNREITLSEIGQLKYLDMVVKETLRLFTIPETLRYMPEDMKLGEYIVPAGAYIYLSLYRLHRDKKYWSHPHEFYPEHFLPENIAARPKCSFLPFLLGPRGCPGSRYALASVKVMLVHVLRNFTVECDLKLEEFNCKPNIMLELIGGYNVRVIPRKTKSL